MKKGNREYPVVGRADLATFGDIIAYGDGKNRQYGVYIRDPLSSESADVAFYLVFPIVSGEPHNNSSIRSDTHIALFDYALADTDIAFFEKNQGALYVDTSKLVPIINTPENLGVTQKGSMHYASRVENRGALELLSSKAEQREKTQSIGEALEGLEEERRTLQGGTSSARHHAVETYGSAALSTPDKRAQLARIREEDGIEPPQNPTGRRRKSRHTSHGTSMDMELQTAVTLGILDPHYARIAEMAGIATLREGELYYAQVRELSTYHSDLDMDLASMTLDDAIDLDMMDDIVPDSALSHKLASAYKRASTGKGYSSTARQQIAEAFENAVDKFPAIQANELFKSMRDAFTKLREEISNELGEEAGERTFMSAIVQNNQDDVMKKVARLVRKAEKRNMATPTEDNDSVAGGPA